MAAINHQYDLSELIALYTISFNNNKQTTIYDLVDYTNNIYNFLAHCNWLSAAAFKGYDPGYVNQQIIQVDGHPLVYHKEICYCPHDGD